MTCPNAEKWDLLSMDLLEQHESTALLGHARECETCRRQLGQARRDHTALSRAFEVFDRNHDELRDSLLAGLPPATPQRVIRPFGPGATGRRVLAVLLPAACILIALFIIFTPGRSNVAFAQVCERMRQMSTMVCDFTTVSTLEWQGQARRHETRGTLSMYSAAGGRAWLLNLSDPPSTQLNLPDRLVTTAADGTREIIRLNPAPSQSQSAGLVEGPEVWLSRLIELTTEPDRELGPETIDGRPALGFEIAGWKLGYGSRPAPGSEPVVERRSVARVWVDTESRLPLKLEVETARPFGSSRMNTVWDHMRWDVPLDPQAFEPPAPSESDRVQQLLVAPPSEESLITGLRAYAEQSRRIKEMLEQTGPGPGGDPDRLQQMRQMLFLDSDYPQWLDLEWLAGVAPVRESSLIIARGIAARQAGDPEAATRAHAEAASTSQTMAEAVWPLGMFYRRLLLDGCEPEYYGQTVQPGDAAAVLLRWKITDGGWRVIYGDLHAETLPLAQNP